MAKSEFIKLGPPSLKSGAILMVSSIVLLQILSWIMSEFFNWAPINLAPALFLIVVGAAVVLPYVILDAPPHFTIVEIVMVAVIILIDLVLLASVMPQAMPNIFSDTAASILKFPI